MLVRQLAVSRLWHGTASGASLPLELVYLLFHSFWLRYSCLHELCQKAENGINFSEERAVLIV